MKLRLGMTSFKHVGVFPEQAPNWEYIYARTRELAGGGGKPKVLNLFAYTGAASLAARAAGADVPIWIRSGRWSPGHAGTWRHPASTEYAGWSRTR